MQPFVVKLSSLAPGANDFEWSTSPEFFEYFGNNEILTSDVSVSVQVCNHGLTVDVSCDIEGSVTIACDRCLADLEIPIETFFDETYTAEGDELDLRQDIYDYICTALPLQRVHPEGECDETTTKYLSK